MSSYEELSSNQKVRVALFRDVMAICTETCHNRGFTITTPTMAIIAELLHKKLSMYGSDLESFAKHANRSNITTEDVKLLVRRNPSLLKLVSAKCSKPVQVQKRRLTTPNVEMEKRSKKPKTVGVIKETEYNGSSYNFPDLPSTSKASSDVK